MVLGLSVLGAGPHPSLHHCPEVQVCLQNTLMPERLSCYDSVCEARMRCQSLDAVGGALLRTYNPCDSCAVSRGLVLASQLKLPRPAW